MQKSIIPITFTEILRNPSKFSAKGYKQESIRKLRETISHLRRIHNPENSFKYALKWILLEWAFRRECVVISEIDFLLRKFADLMLALSFVESTYLNIDMYKSESLQNDENRAQSADSSKAYRKPRAFVYAVRSTVTYFTI